MSQSKTFYILHNSTVEVVHEKINKDVVLLGEKEIVCAQYVCLKQWCHQNFLKILSRFAARFLELQSLFRYHMLLVDFYANFDLRTFSVTWWRMMEDFWWMESLISIKMSRCCITFSFTYVKIFKRICR